MSNSYSTAVGDECYELLDSYDCLVDSLTQNHSIAVCYLLAMRHSYQLYVLTSNYEPNVDYIRHYLLINFAKLKL